MNKDRWRMPLKDDYLVPCRFRNERSEPWQDGIYYGVNHFSNDASEKYMCDTHGGTPTPTGYRYCQVRDGFSFANSLRKELVD